MAPTGPAKVTFRWKISAEEGVDSLVFTMSGNEKGRISENSGWVEEEFLIPAGPQVMRWTYEKSSSLSSGEDAGFLDRVEIEPVDMPDLVITDVIYAPGEYVLDRDRLSLQVTVRNEGAAVDEGIWDASDVEVRLSENSVWGTEGDIILGNFAKVESFDSGKRLVFSGDLALPLSTPAGDYYLAIQANPFEKVEEWSYENNFFWSDVRNVTIKRLPNLVLWGLDFEVGKVFYPLSTLEFDFEVRNVGLGAVSSEDGYTHRVDLRAREIADDEEGEEPDGDEEEFDWTQALLIKSYEIPEDAYMPGVSDQRPEGHSISYETNLGLPDELELLRELGIVDADATQAMVNDADREELENWEFSLTLTLDANDDVAESDEANVYSRGGLGLFMIEPVLLLGPDQTLAEWAEANDVTLPASGTSEYQDRLKEYAFDLVPGSAGSLPPLQFNRVTVDGSEYGRLTFPIVKGATDLRYTVEVSDDLGDWTELVVLEPPYNRSHGPESLTGIDGLLEMEPLVLAASDQGYTAAMSIRDSASLEDGEQRFLRVKIESISQ